MQEIEMFTPGPAHVPLSLRLAGISQLTHHRTEEFAELFDRIRGGLRRLFDTSGEILMLSASGTGAMESIVANIVAPGDAVLVVAAGKYGRRWAELCRAHQADVQVHDVADGADVDYATLQEELALRPPRYLFLTHCETSTGATYDLRRLAELGRACGAAVIADTLTTVGVEPFHMDAWDIDFAITASHKGLMSPSGAAFVAVGDRGWDYVRPAQGYSYWNYLIMRASARSCTVPNTPPGGILLSVSAALDIIESDGLPSVWARHTACAEVCRQGVSALGLPVFPQARPSCALTAAAVPGGASGLVSELYDRFGIRIANGQGELNGKIIRIGHIGSTTALDLFPVITALEMVMLRRGLALEPGLAAAAMARALYEQIPHPVPVGSSSRESHTAPIEEFT